MKMIKIPFIIFIIHIYLFNCSPPPLHNYEWLNKYIDLPKKSIKELKFLKNEIYARHGYIFQSEEFQEHFLEQSWYKPNETFDESVLINKEKELLTNIIKIIKDKKKNAICIQSFKDGSPKYIDLNGDGVQETILFRGNQIIQSISNNIYISWPLQELNIIDIDIEDEYKEIALGYDEASDDYMTDFYYYNGKEVKFMGKVEGVIRYSNIKHCCYVRIDGTGKLSSSTKSYVLETWFYNLNYKIGENRKLIPIKQDLYYMGRQFTMKTNLPIQKSRTDSTIIGTLQIGEKVTVLSNDNKRWCLIKNDKGLKGWFEVENFHIVKCLGKQSMQVFKGLVIAD